MRVLVCPPGQPTVWQTVAGDLTSVPLSIAWPGLTGPPVELAINTVHVGACSVVVYAVRAETQRAFREAVAATRRCEQCDGVYLRDPSKRSTPTRFCGRRCQVAWSKAHWNQGV